MGATWSRQQHLPVSEEKRGHKRKHEDDDEKEDETIQTELNTPKKKKLRTTSKYIYQTLFVEGRNSDVKITALGQEWRLHRIYLCQSDYFSSMFSGSWTESDKKEINMTIPDYNIDREALAIAFGSLYQDDISITPNHVVSVLAAATLLGLDGLIQQCANIMQETISSATACFYHTASITYGLQIVQQSCIEWLEKNLLASQNVKLLTSLSPALMTQIISSSNLFVIQVEMDIYSLLKKWVFLQLNINWNGSFKDLLIESDTFFKSHKSKNCRAFLETELGLPYGEVFRGLRLWHIMNDATSTNLLEEDMILPLSWVLPVYRDQWHQLLKIEQGTDIGPEGENHPDFSQMCLRVGRILPKDSEFCWRWTGFNYGVDILVTVTNRLLLIKRNCSGMNCAGSVSQTNNRRFLYRISVASFDNKGQTKYFKSTGIKSASLGRDEETAVLSIERNVKFPVHVSANFLFFTPISDRIANHSQIISVGNSCSSNTDSSHSSANESVLRSALEQANEHFPE